MTDIVHCKDCYYWSGRGFPMSSKQIEVFTGDGDNTESHSAEGNWGNCKLHSSAMGVQLYPQTLAVAIDCESYEANHICNENYGCIEGVKVSTAFC